MIGRWGVAFLGGSGWELGCGSWYYVYRYVYGYGWRIDLCQWRIWKMPIIAKCDAYGLVFCTAGKLEIAIKGN